MDENYLEDILKSLAEKQQALKDTLNEAFLRATSEDEKDQISKVLNYNEQIEQAIKNKDLETLQKIYSDASTNI